MSERFRRNDGWLTGEEKKQYLAARLPATPPASETADAAWGRLRNGLSKAYVASDIDDAIATARPDIEAAIRAEADERIAALREAAASVFDNSWSRYYEWSALRAALYDAQEDAQ